MYDEETCDYLWEQFYNWAKGKEFSDSAKKVDQIHIMYEDGGAIERIEKSICYKKERIPQLLLRIIIWKRDGVELLIGNSHMAGEFVQSPANI